MARIYRENGYNRSNSRSFVNIDDLMRVFSSAERAEGLPETFTLRVPEDTPTKCSSCKSNGKCASSPKPVERKMTPFQCGNFDMSLDGTDVEDDDDGIYVCDLCERIGYSGKYVPEICDTCKACAGCNEYDTGECSGCSYSVYRDGEYYHEKLPESDLISERDFELFSELNETYTKRFTRSDGVSRFRNR
jgi:hypothetical protein